jgi:hypothetical protein
MTARQQPTPQELRGRLMNRGLCVILSAAKDLFQAGGKQTACTSSPWQKSSVPEPGLSGQLFVGETHPNYHGFASFRRLDLTRNSALPATEHFRHGLRGGA